MKSIFLMTRFIHIFDCEEKRDAFLEMNMNETVGDLLNVYYRNYGKNENQNNVFLYLDSKFIAKNILISEIDLKPNSFLIIQHNSKKQRDDIKKSNSFKIESNKPVKSFPECCFNAPSW